MFMNAICVTVYICWRLLNECYSDFSWSYNAQYGNCYTFNSGWNTSVPPIVSLQAGPQYGMLIRRYCFLATRPILSRVLTIGVGRKYYPYYTLRLHVLLFYFTPSAKAQSLPFPLVFSSSTLLFHSRFNDCIGPMLRLRGS